MVVVVGQRSVQCIRTLGDLAALVCAQNFPLARSTKYARSQTYVLGLRGLRFFSLSLSLCLSLYLFLFLCLLFSLYLALSAVQLPLGTARAFFPIRPKPQLPVLPQFDSP